MKLLVVLASVREGRAGESVAHWFVKKVEQDGRFEVELVDLKQISLSYELPAQSPSMVTDSVYERQEDTDWAARVNAADAVVFVSPEYNHGYPASLKNAIDHLYHEWRGKPAGFVGYGSAGAPFAWGSFGLVAAWVGLDIVNAHVGIAEIWAAFDKDGMLRHDEYHSYEATTLLDSLARKVSKNE